MEQHVLQDKIAKIEALFAGTHSAGEREAAGLALDRLLARLREEQERDQVVEHKFTGFTPYSKVLFMALLRRYGLEPFRYYRQRQSTIMVSGPRNFINNVIWPEFNELNTVLREHLSDITEKIITQYIHPSVEDEKERGQINGCA